MDISKLLITTALLYFALSVTAQTETETTVTVTSSVKKTCVCPNQGQSANDSGHTAFGSYVASDNAKAQAAQLEMQTVSQAYSNGRIDTLTYSSIMNKAKREYQEASEESAMYDSFHGPADPNASNNPCNCDSSN